MEQASQISIHQMVDWVAADFVQKCTNCGLCLQACPMFPMTKCGDKDPAVVMQEITGLLSGGEISDETLDMIWTCSGGEGACRSCFKACPEGLWLGTPLVFSARAKAVRAGKKPPHIYDLRAARQRGSLGNVLAALQVKPSEERWIRQVPANPKPVDVAIAIGCCGAMVPHVPLDFASVLEKMGVNFAMLAGGHYCCGNSELIRGDVETARRYNLEWASAITALNPKKAMFFCYGCRINAQGGLHPPLPVQTQDLYDFLNENLDKIPLAHKVNKVVAIYDSCNVVHTQNWDTTRKLLGAIPGIKLVEMEHCKENAQCCGGLSAVMYPESTAPIRHGILKEAKAAGAEVLAMTCAGCERLIEPLDHEYGIEVQDVVSLLAESVGVKHEDRYRMYSKCRNLAEVLAKGQEFIEASDYSMEEMRKLLPEHVHVLFGTHRK